MKDFPSFLEYIKESKLKFKPALERRFGKKLVISKDFTLTTDISKDLFDFLNEYFFAGKLKRIPVKCISYDQILDIMKARPNQILPDNKFIVSMPRKGNHLQWLP